MTTRTNEQQPVPAATSGGADIADGTHGFDAVDASSQTGRGFVRDRQHRFPGRKNALKVLYDDAEVGAVRSAAEAAGLTATGFVAAAGLTLAGAALPPALSADRQVLAELLQIRTALGRYGVNLNQAVAALNSGGGAPVWLLQAVAGCARAADGVDALTATLARRLG